MGQLLWLAAADSAPDHASKPAPPHLFVETLGPDRLRQGLAEARAATALRHENLLLPHAVGQERGLAYCALPFCEGQPLAVLLEAWRRQAIEPSAAAGVSPEEGPRGGPDFFQWVARLGTQAAEALDRAHRHGALHRDLKPANLFVAPCGRLWVADLGLTCFRGEGWLNAPGDLRHTLPYRSPEQALGCDGAGTLSDVYALGACLFEALTLRPPFAGPDWRGLLRQVRTGAPPSPRRWCAALPADLEAVVLRAMSREPGARYASAAELAADLRRFLAGRPVPPRRPNPLSRAGAWLRSRLG